MAVSGASNWEDFRSRIDVDQEQGFELWRHRQSSLKAVKAHRIVTVLSSCRPMTIPVVSCMVPLATHAFETRLDHRGLTRAPQLISL
jgi:hypothetical protein